MLAALFVALTLANDAESPVCDDVVDVAIEQFDPIEPVGVGVVIVVAKRCDKQIVFVNIFKE